MEYWQVLAVYKIVSEWLKNADELSLTDDDKAEVDSFKLWLSDYLEEA